MGKLLSFGPVETQEGKFEGLCYSAHVSSIYSLVERCKIFSRRASRSNIRAVHHRPERWGFPHASGKEHCDVLALTFEGTAGGQDFLSEIGWSIDQSSTVMRGLYLEKGR